jgi:hypothetical protein
LPGSLLGTRDRGGTTAGVLDFRLFPALERTCPTELCRERADGTVFGPMELGITCVVGSRDRGATGRVPVFFRNSDTIPAAGGLLKNVFPSEFPLPVNKLAGGRGPTVIPDPGANDDNAAFIRFPTPDPLRSERDVRFSDDGGSSPRAFRAACEANFDK